MRLSACCVVARRKPLLSRSVEGCQQAICDGSQCGIEFGGLSFLPLERDLDDAIDLEGVVERLLVELRPQLVDQVRIRNVCELGCLVVRLEGLQDVGGIVYEVDDKGLVLTRVATVQPNLP